MLGIIINLLPLSQSHLRSEPTCGFTPHFQAYLRQSVPNIQFQNQTLSCAEFGGKTSPVSEVRRTPVIFIHGNSDIAFGRGTADGYKDWQTGFRSLAGYFMEQGYSPSELYTYTWGNGNSSLASQNNHRKIDLVKLRLFITAVLNYTNSSQVDIIGHSMGVTLGRKAIKGGVGKDQASGVYDLGLSLSKRVRHFIGIAGANLGLTNCYDVSTLPTCSKLDGFYPGLLPTSGPSVFLAGLKDGVREADKIYSIWSEFDDLIGYGCEVYGKVTSRIEGQDGEFVKRSAEWTHFKLRDLTGPDILSIFAKSV